MQLRFNCGFWILDFRLLEQSQISISKPQIPNPKSQIAVRHSFTLTELLIVIAIVSIMAGLALSAIAGAMELAREQRTRAIIAKLDQLIMERYDSYRTRAVPIRIPQMLGDNGSGQPARTPPKIAAQIRLYAFRDLMRMEMPERITDVVDKPAIIYQAGSPWNAIVQIGRTSTVTQPDGPSLWKSYRRLAQRALGSNWQNVWTQQNEGAECLYLILSTMHDGDKQALDFFQASEIGDTDDDGMREILDAWGNPIHFLRWAPGYTTANNCLTTQVADRNAVPDAFDPLKVDPRWTESSSAIPYAMRPLIVSAGRDKQLDLAMKGSNSSGGQFQYTSTNPVNDPYYTPTASGQVPFGTPQDFDSDGFGHADNITNHYQETP